MNKQLKTKSGLFITLEGIEGTGKTTQAKLLAERMKSLGLDVMVTFEPGGTVIGQKIREILLLPEHGEMSFVAELLLYYADRAQHIAEKIVPALEKGSVVITDRYSDSTFAYQGYGRGIDLSLIEEIDSIATRGIKPDMTLLFDLAIEIGLARNRDINKVDRLELEALEFHQRVRNGFTAIAEKDPMRVRMIDASMPISAVHEAAWKIVKDALDKRGLISK